MNLFNPLVSICLPVYNGEKYIEEAIKSAIKQTYRPLEIIVSDDKSSDNSIKIIKQIISNTDIPVYIYSHNPNGIGSNWNNCIKKSNGEYIKFLFQDDILKEDCIEIMLDKFRSDPHSGMVFCSRELVGHENKALQLEQYQKKLYPVNPKNFLQHDDNFFRSPRNKIGEPIVTLIPKTTFLKVGYFNERLKQELDFEFWLRICHKFKIGYIESKLVTFRIHEEQATAINKKGKIKDDFMLPWIVLIRYFFTLKLKIRLILMYNTFEGIYKYYFK